MHQYRTHTCGELTKQHVGLEVKLSGWVHGKRDHGNLLFIDLRDHYGITQCITTVESHMIEQISSVRFESVVTITGKVTQRSNETVNSNLATGDIEVKIESFQVESEIPGTRFKYIVQRRD